MSSSSSLRELVAVLQRIEDKLVSAVHVKLGLIYLKWSAAMLGFMLAALILDLVGAEDVVYLYAVAAYWPTVTYLILFRGRPGYSRTLDTYVRMYFRKREVGRDALRKYYTLYSVGWIAASIVGFVLIPLFLGSEYWISGYPVFIGVGILVSHIGMERCLKIYDRGFLVFPLVLIASGVLLVCAVQISWSLSYYTAITVPALVFLLIGARYILKAIT